MRTRLWAPSMTCNESGDLRFTRRPNHGIQTAYEFGLDIGGMERSKYFGLLRDLYHFDHFMGKYLPPACSQPNGSLRSTVATNENMCVAVQAPLRTTCRSCWATLQPIPWCLAKRTLTQRQSE